MHSALRTRHTIPHTPYRTRHTAHGYGSSSSESLISMTAGLRRASGVCCTFGARGARGARGAGCADGAAAAAIVGVGATTRRS